MRQKVRGLRGIERSVLKRRQASGSEESPSTAEVAAAVPDDPSGDVVLAYCAAVRGILNNDQGGPLHPPGLEMSDALTEVRQSLGRNLAAEKGASRRRN